MTGDEFGEVDVDLLADYVGGALAGTPDEDAVAELVATDAAWRAAHTALGARMSAVGVELRALGASPELMPADVAVRLSAALAELPLPTAATSADSDADPDTVAADPDPDAVDAGPATAAGPRRRLTAVPSSPAGPSSPDPGRARPGRAGAAAARRRRLLRWGAPISVAAALVAFGGFGVNRLLSGGAEDSGGVASTAARDAGPGDAPLTDSGQPRVFAGEKGEAALSAPPPADRITASGLDYTADALRAQLPAPVAPTTTGPSLRAAQDQGNTSGKVVSGGVDPALSRLADRGPLLDCLAAIGATHGAGPISVRTVDYARFEGAPALVVTFTAADGSWVWASGPQCGMPGAGADTRRQQQVG